jgi:hypothetical protein
MVKLAAQLFRSAAEAKKREAGVGQEKQREAFSRKRLLMILQGGAKSVIRGLRPVATARKLSGEALGLVKDRVERSVRRWTLVGAKSLLNL